MLKFLINHISESSIGFRITFDDKPIWPYKSNEDYGEMSTVEVFNKLYEQFSDRLYVNHFYVIQPSTCYTIMKNLGQFEQAEFFRKRYVAIDSNSAFEDYNQVWIYACGNREKQMVLEVGDELYPLPFDEGLKELENFMSSLFDALPKTREYAIARSQMNLKRNEAKS